MKAITSIIALLVLLTSVASGQTTVSASGIDYRIYLNFWNGPDGWYYYCDLQDHDPNQDEFIEAWEMSRYGLDWLDIEQKPDECWLVKGDMGYCYYVKVIRERNGSGQYRPAVHCNFNSSIITNHTTYGERLSFSGGSSGQDGRAQMSIGLTPDKHGNADANGWMIAWNAYTDSVSCTGEFDNIAGVGQQNGGWTYAWTIFQGTYDHQGGGIIPDDYDPCSPPMQMPEEQWDDDLLIVLDMSANGDCICSDIDASINCIWKELFITFEDPNDPNNIVFENLPVEKISLFPMMLPNETGQCWPEDFDNDPNRTREEYLDNYHSMAEATIIMHDPNDPMPIAGTVDNIDLYSLDPNQEAFLGPVPVRCLVEEVRENSFDVKIGPVFGIVFRDVTKFGITYNSYAAFQDEGLTVISVPENGWIKLDLPRKSLLGLATGWLTEYYDEDPNDYVFGGDGNCDGIVDMQDLSDLANSL